MTTITGYTFDTAEGAEKMLDLVQDLSRQELITVEDAATVTWPKGKKKPKIKHLESLTGRGALGGAFWGMVFGLIFFIPVLGIAVGTAAGAIAGHFADVGIPKDFINSAREKVTEGTSALFLMTEDVVRDKVTDAVNKSGLNFDLFYTDLSKEQEQQLREHLAS